MNTKIHNPSRQKGAALITSLAMLMVLTLIGLSAMNTTTMEEKMTGSVRNKQESFQRAEEALRFGEQQALQNEQNKTPPGNDAGFYPFTMPGDANYPIWDAAAGKDYNGWYAVNATEMDQFASHDYNPTFVIEFVTNFQQNPNCALNNPAAADCDTHTIYRVTARAQGLNNRADTTVQSMYRARQ